MQLKEIDYNQSASERQYAGERNQLEHAGERNR